MRLRLLALLVLLALVATPAALGCVPIKCLDEVDDRFDLPRCDEYEFNQALIASAKQGDRSAVELLRQRYELTSSSFERHRVAATLLGRVSDDSRYWNELAERAKDAIRFAYDVHDPSLEYLQWCEARGIDPMRYRWVSIDAFRTAVEDLRGRGLLAEALDSKDLELFETALAVTIDHRDESALPRIERGFARFPDRAWEMAFWLMAFESGDADRLALKFIDEADRATYWEQRNTLLRERMDASEP